MTRGRSLRRSPDPLCQLSCPPGPSVRSVARICSGPETLPEPNEDSIPPDPGLVKSYFRRMRVFSSAWITVSPRSLLSTLQPRGCRETERRRHRHVLHGRRKRPDLRRAGALSACGCARAVMPVGVCGCTRRGPRGRPSSMSGREALTVIHDRKLAWSWRSRGGPVV